MSLIPGTLGMLPPANTRHRQLYPLTAQTMPVIPTPVVLGINWYQNFDAPQRDKRSAWWIGQAANWGRVRGGHAICIKPPALTDLLNWWEFYDQGAEGACVGFAIARMMSLLNRRRYDAYMLYKEAQVVDDWPGEDYQGTTVRAGCDVARKQGLHIIRSGKTRPSSLQDGIAENRWATSVEEIAACLSPIDCGARVLNNGFVTLLNSWGTHYPHRCQLPLEALDRLVFAEGGEATVVIDK